MEMAKNLANDLLESRPVQPMQQYDQYKQDYRRQERRRNARKSSGLSAAMQNYIDEAASFVDPSISRS